MALQHPSDNPVKHRFSDLPKEKRLEIKSWKVNVKETFNLAYIYKILHDWGVAEGWAPADDSKFQEVYYLQRDNPNFGKELRIRWRWKKDAPSLGKLFTYTMDVDFYTLGIKDTEMSWQGQKIKAQKGEFEIECVAALLIDEEGSWDKSILKPLKEIYIKRIIKNKFTSHKIEVENSSMRFRDFIVEHFRLHKFFPEKEASEFFSKKDLG